MIEENKENTIRTENDYHWEKFSNLDYDVDNPDKATVTDKQEGGTDSFVKDSTSDYKSSSIPANSVSYSSLRLTKSGTDQIDFHPELFGLLGNPGVVRFGCLDYPLAVIEDSDEEYEVEHKTDNDWIRVSCDDLTQDIDTAEDIFKDSKIVSRSLDNISNL